MTAERSLSKSRLSRIIAYRVARLHSETVKVLSRLCEENGFTFNVWKVFSAVGSFEPVSAVEICRMTTIDKAMVSRVIRQLVDRELIERRLAGRDARLVEIQLTPAGKRAYTRTARAIDALQKELLTGVSGAKVDEFIATLELLEERTKLLRDKNTRHGKSARKDKQGKGNAGKQVRGKRNGSRWPVQDEARDR